MRKIISDNLKLIGEGGEGKVYCLNNDQILKVYKNASLEAVKYWYRVINSAINYGISSSKPYEIVEVDGRYGIIFDYLNGKSLGKTIASKPELLEEYAERMGMLLKQLHTTEDKLDLLENVDERMQKWYDESCQRNILPDNVAEKLQNILNSIPARTTLLHGDFHEGNIIVQNNELLCVDLDRVGSGHPIYDLMGLYLNHDVAKMKVPEFFQKSWGLTVEQAFSVKNRMLKTYYGINDDKLLKEYEDIVAKAFFIRQLLFPVSPTLNLTDDAARNYVQKIIPGFLSVADDLPDMIKMLPI